MNMTEQEVWPFNVSKDDLRWPEMVDKIRFLEDATNSGCRAFRFGINNYGARQGKRSGVILERGRNRWELRLSVDDNRRLLAYLSSFPSAGEALLRWCNGDELQGILAVVRDQLIVPPGASASHVIEDSEDSDD
jgi:hypothetical protein